MTGVVLTCMTGMLLYFIYYNINCCLIGVQDNMYKIIRNAQRILFENNNNVNITHFIYIV